MKALWFGRSDVRDPSLRSRQHEPVWVAANDLEPAIEKVIDQINKLTLVAHRDGMIMGVPHREKVGEWLKPGKPFCEVGDPHHLEAHMILDQGDITT